MSTVENKIKTKWTYMKIKQLINNFRNGNYLVLFVLDTYAKP